MNNDIIQNIPSFGSDYKGLSTIQAQEASKKYGFNVRPVTQNKTWFKRALGIATEPMILLLCAAAIIYFFLGDHIEALILLISIVPVVIMQFIQQQRTDQAIEALNKIMVEFCQVYRDGHVQKMETKILVPGDMVYLTAGDKAPADGVLLNSHGLMIDESILTGESVAVTKKSFLAKNELTEEEKLYQGTLVVQGEGYFVVTDTGLHTAYGKLGSLLEKIEKLQTPLQKNIRRLVSRVAIAAIFISLLVGILLTLQYDWIHGLLGAITMFMSLIPEEFPIVFSVFLIMGVWRMTKQKALTREMAMVETLGSATVICTDKTGTLTEGKMALEEIYFNNKICEVKNLKKHSADFEKLIKSALLALEQVAIDPMEVEVQNFATKLGINVEQYYHEHALIEDKPFEAKTKTVHHLWKNKESVCIQFSAGAPETIFKNSALSSHDKKLAEKAYEEMASKGQRVIAIAKKDCSDSKTIALENMEFVGLLAMSDPPRAEVKAAIDICQKAGIRVMMITGDNKLTAHSIAEQIGLKHNETIIVGTELENISSEALKEIVRHHDIFTRVKPEQKFEIVEALQSLGEVVAMTGDGVNDAPALKKANIGIAMGQKGTEVARAAAGIVLLDDNFSTIVNAVREGRRIYDNLRQAFVFLFSFHLPVVGLAVLPLFFGQPLVFLPIHIVFLELFCDPASVIGFEREKARQHLMLESPRGPHEPLINIKLLSKILIQGLGILAISFGFYYYFAINSNQMETGRTLAFASLVISQTLLILTSREWHQIKSNWLLLIISFLTLVFLYFSLTLPAWQNIFHLTDLNIEQTKYLIFVPILSVVLIKLLLKIKKIKSNL